jgi:hypothetical protein
MAGRGQTNGWQPFFALEFGMSHTKYHTYIRTSPRGLRHVVRRRTGTWAKPHKGRTGYWFYPYWRRHDDRLTARVVELLDGFMEGAL